MKQVHMICNAHIDPIWQWDWQEGVSAVLSTFQSAVDLAKRFDYIFCHNEVTVYKYVEEYAPLLFERIKELVKCEKWHVMGGWYLQPDCNMPCGESFVRQILEGKRYFKEKFGVEPSTATNFDPFGHTAGLVQILKKCGQDSYLFMRPYAHECDLPSEQFIWRGLDGSEIKANRALRYGSPLGLAADRIKKRSDIQPENTVCVLWGVGNHGGGPSAKDLSDIETLKKHGDKHYIHSTPERFFAAIQPTAVFDRSLRISMPGCYTSMSKVKRKHALLESEIYLTEKMLTVALATGAMKAYPEEEMHGVVQDLLNAEFHDVLPGTCIQSGEENGLKLLDRGLLGAEKMKTRAYFALCSAEAPAKEGEYPILVFNPHPYPLKTNVECEFMLADQNWDEDLQSVIRIEDTDGTALPLQVIKEESTLNLDWRKRILFEAELAPLQLSRYSVYVDLLPRSDVRKSSDLVYDNGRKHVEIDPHTGLLKKYAVNGVTYIENGCQPVMLRDNPDPWGMGADQLLRLGTNEEPFLLSQVPSGVFKNLKSVEVIEDGALCLAIEAFFEKDHSRARICYKIYKNNDFVDMDVDVFFGECDKFAKLKLPICAQGRLVGQTAFGTEALFTDARENVAQRFVAMEYANGTCLAVMNTNTYGSHFENGALYLSLVRGVGYCVHPIKERDLLPSNRYIKRMDQGENNFSFRIGVIKRDALERATQEFTQKPYAVNVFPTKASATMHPFDVRLADEVISLVTAKKADDKDALIFRLFNNTNAAVDTAFTVQNATIPLHFTKFEVKTLLFENGMLTESAQLLI